MTEGEIAFLLAMLIAIMFVVAGWRDKKRNDKDEWR